IVCNGAFSSACNLLHVSLETSAREHILNDQSGTIYFSPSAQLSSIINHEAARDLTSAALSRFLRSYRRCLDVSLPRLCVTASLGFLPGVCTACCHFTLLFRYSGTLGPM